MIFTAASNCSLFLGPILGRGLVVRTVEVVEENVQDGVLEGEPGRQDVLGMIGFDCRSIELSSSWHFLHATHSSYFVVFIHLVSAPVAAFNSSQPLDGPILDQGGYRSSRSCPGWCTRWWIRTPDSGGQDNLGTFAQALNTIQHTT